MNEHLLHDYGHFVILFWTIVALTIMIAGLLFLRFIRSGEVHWQRYLSATGHPNADLVSKANVASSQPSRTDLASQEHAATLPVVSNKNPRGEHDQVHDTLFILPDISNYTRFISSKNIDNERSQLIIFGLMNAMIQAAANTLELSKIEGDAVLFYKGARKANGAEIGKTVMAVFNAFFDEQHRLMKECSDQPDMRSEIANLDLKIFVHRGRTHRFNFRGTTDHFGTDVTILLKLMKNSICSNRYVMVTEAAEDCIQLPAHFQRQRTEEILDHVGVVQTSVFTFGSNALSVHKSASVASKIDQVRSSSREIV